MVLPDGRTILFKCKGSIIGGNYDRRMTGLAVGPFFGLKKVPQPALPYSTSGD